MLKNVTRFRGSIRRKNIKYWPKKALPAPPRSAPVGPILPPGLPVLVRLIRPAITGQYSKLLHRGTVGRVANAIGGKWIVWFLGAVVGVAADSDFIEVVK